MPVYDESVRQEEASLAPPPPVTWAETRRDLAADLGVYEAWFGLRSAGRSFWLRCATAMLRADTFGSNLLYRLEAFLVGTRGRWLAPWLGRCNRALFGVTIGPFVRIGGGLYVAHGHVVIEGVTRIGARASIAPFVTIGLTSRREGGIEFRGATIGDDAVIGTGAKIIGPVRIGDRVRIGANAVVLDDVPDDRVAIGVPARASR